MRKFFLATLLAVMMIATNAFAAGWEQIYTDDGDNQVFLDKSTVKTAVYDENDATFSAVFRINYSDRGRAALIDWYRYNSIVPNDIESIAYDVAMINFRKSGDVRDYYVITRTAYRADGSVIPEMQFNNINPVWESIEVGSLLEVEYFNAFLIVQDKDFD